MIRRFSGHRTALALIVLLTAATLGGCSRTWGAPENDLGGAPSAAEATQEVQEEEAEESINR